MSVSPAVLMLSVSIGVPLMLLALGVLYHAYVLGRQQSTDFDDLGAHVEALATESTDALLIDLRDAVEHMQSQLSRQRESLAGLLSETRSSTPTFATSMAAASMAGAMPSTPAPAAAPAPRVAPVAAQIDVAPLAEPRMAAGSYVANARMADAPITPTGSLTSAVAELVSEGLSDRAIARQLHIGLEEVRMARMRTSR